MVALVIAFHGNVEWGRISSASSLDRTTGIRAYASLQGTVRLDADGSSHSIGPSLPTNQ
jgi:hypothetical protein